MKTVWVVFHEVNQPSTLASFVEGLYATKELADQAHRTLAATYRAAGEPIYWDPNSGCLVYEHNWKHDWLVYPMEVAETPLDWDDVKVLR